MNPIVLPSNNSSNWHGLIFVFFGFILGYFMGGLVGGIVFGLGFFIGYGFFTKKLDVKESIFFIALFGLHFYDFYAGFQRGGGQVYIFVLAYLFLALLAVFIFTKAKGVTEILKNWGVFLIPSAIAVFIPLLRTFIEVPGVDFVLVFFPAWFLFFIVRQDLIKSELIKQAMLIILLAWVIVAIVFAISKLGLDNLDTGSYSVDASSVIGDTWKFVSGAFSDLGDKNVFPDLPDPGEFINRTLAELTAEKYKGKVEQGRYMALGVKISNIETLDSLIYENSPLIVWADITASTLEDEEINVVNECSLSKGTSVLEVGIIRPESFSIIREDFRNLECALSGREKGQYKVNFKSTFDFNTLAYVPFHFISQELLNSYRREGVDVNRELDVPEEPMAIYTPGPLKIGINSGSQPLGVENNIETRVFGVTLDPDWHNGRLLKINELVFALPNELEIDSCSGVAVSDMRVYDEGYTAYVFNDISVVKNSFKTINCWFKVVDVPSLLIGSLNTRTLLVDVDYTYEVSSYKVINVIEVPVENE